jgi:hypothetical protein
MDWQHLAVAPDQVTAEMWVQFLRDAGIPAMIRPSDSASFLGSSGFGVRVQVRSEDRQRALEILGLDESEAHA